MMTKKIVGIASLHAVATVLYVFLVVLLMQFGEHLFSGRVQIIQGAAVLLLFVISATIVGTLVLGRPVMLFMSGQKKLALQLFSSTLAALLILTAIIFGVLFFLK